MATTEDSFSKPSDSERLDKSKIDFTQIEPGEDLNKSMRFLQGQMKTFRDEFLETKFKIDKFIKMSMNDIKGINNELSCFDETKRMVDLV